jgi:hypothetical protein
MPREERDRDRNDHKIQNPLQNKLVIDKEGEEEEIDPKIHYIGDSSLFPHLNQSTYEESLIDSQINKLSKGEKENSGPSKYKLWSKKKEGKFGISNQPSILDKPVKDAANNNKVKKSQTPSPVVNEFVSEVREIMKPPSFFNFEHEIQNIRIPVPLLELFNNEDFKRSLSKLLQSDPSCHSIDSVNLQDEKPAVILGPMVQDRDDSSHPFYTSLNIHDKLLHNFLMDSGASHNLMPKIFMEEIGLEITKTYHDLYYFDSRRV